MRYLAAIAALLLACSLASSNFTFLYSANGSLKSDSDDYYRFLQPTGLCLAGGTLYVADSGKGILYMLNTSANLSRAKFVTSPSSEAYLTNPMHMEYEGSTGDLYISGGSTGSILYYNGVGSTLDKWNSGTTSLQKVNGIALANDTIYIADGTLGQVQAFSRTTKAYSRVAVQKGDSDGLLSSPQDILFHGGRIYISDSAKGLVFVYGANFTFEQAIGRGKGGITLKSPRGMDFDDNRIYVADAVLGAVVAFSLDGYPVDVLNSSTAGGSLSYPEDVIVQNGTLYVADTQNRLIKAFAINKTGGDPDVLAMITGANATCASLASMQAVASRLNISFPPVAYSASIGSAQQYYDAYAFSFAASLAGKASSDCASAQASLTQSVELAIRQLVQSSQAKVAPYRNSSTASIQLMVQFDNKASAADFALSSGSYAAAADSALSLPALAGSIVSGSESRAAAEEEKKQNSSLAISTADISALLGRIGQLQAKSDAYRQGINLSSSRELVELAQKSAEGGDYGAANHSLQLAAMEVSSYEATVAGAAKEIDAALAALSAAGTEFNATASKAMLFAPDLSGEKAMMASAHETAYSSPALALQMASQAKSSAEAKSRDAQALSLAAISVLVVLFLIAALSGAFLVHLAGRKRKKGL